MKPQVLFALLLIGGCARIGESGSAHKILAAPAADRLCFSPDPWKKTCAEMAAFRRAAGGGVAETDERLLLANPAIVMRASLGEKLEHGAFCGFVSEDEASAGAFTIDGRPIAAANLAAYQDEVAPSLGLLVGHKTCVAFDPRADGFRASTRVDGVKIDHLSQRVIWVRPEDGYSVGA
ncbi:MAG: hypothetical protein ACRED8_09455 [Caulobacteraceae bacterium]